MNEGGPTNYLYPIGNRPFPMSPHQLAKMAQSG